MADIQKQGTKPFEKRWKKFLPSLKELQVGTKYAKKLGALPAYLNSQLANILKTTGCNIDSDGNGWYYPITKEGERLSLVIAIVNSNGETCTYERINQDLNKEQNKNLGIDAIGSKGYAVNGLYDKVPVKFWGIKIKSAKFAREIAWETSDGENDCKNIIMPVLLIELEENPMCMVKADSINDATAKMQVVINELKNPN